MEHSVSNGTHNYSNSVSNITMMGGCKHTTVFINEYDTPIHTIEKDNCKIMQYELIGLNKNHIIVKKNFVNKTKTLFVIVEGKYKDELTGWENNINIKLEVDHFIYNKVTWAIQDGILTIVLHEIINKEPEVEIQEY